MGPENNREGISTEVGNGSCKYCERVTDGDDGCLVTTGYCRTEESNCEFLEEVPEEYLAGVLNGR